MSFFNVGNPFSTVVGQKIEQATDGALPSENWALNMEICDIINSTADGPRDAIKAIRKRLTQSAGKNYTIVMYTLTVLETSVKNSGKQFHIYACNKEFVLELVKLIGPKNDPPTVVQEKVLSLIQCWADAFQHQPELQGVVQVYQELKTKGVEFPMTDLDTMAPIFTPQRSVPEVPEALVPEEDASPQIAPSSPQPALPTHPVAPATVTLSQNQVSKLRGDLATVEGNMSVMADMLNELTTTNNQPPHASDLELLNELADTLKAMQTRVAELVARLSGDDPLTGELLHMNDELNGLLLRHGRFVRNTSAPSAILGAAMGVPTGAGGEPNVDNDALIDLSDDMPNIKSLSVTDESKQMTGDEFDMFAQSRNLTYENSKTSGSSYADNLDPGQVTSGLAATTQLRPTAGQRSADLDPRDFDEIAAWLESEKEANAASADSNGAQESVTSSDFDKFLAERAAAAEALPNITAPATHREIKKEADKTPFAL